MKRNGSSMILILLLVLVIVLASIFILRGTPAAKDDPSAAPGSKVTPAPPRDTASPASQTSGEASGQSSGQSSGQTSGQTGGGDTPAPAASSAPTAPPTPEPTPEPTPAPTPEPTPAPADAEGSFSSNSGTGLNLRVDWHSYTAADGTRKLKADVSIVSYSIFCSAQYKSITLKIGGNSWSADNPGVSYDGKDQIITPVASFTVDIPAGGTAATVEWYYGGTYSGKSLDVITASGTVK